MSKYFFKWLRFKLLFPLLACLPRPLGYRLADLVGLCDAKLNPLRQGVEQGIGALMPELASSRSVLIEQCQKHYQMLARDTLDCYLMPRFTSENTCHLFKVSNAEILNRAKAAGKGVIMIITHYDRFFMLGPGLNFAGIEFAMLTTVVDERHPSYDKIDRWYMAKKLRNTQMFSRGTWITTADDPRKVYRSLRSEEIVLIAMDGNETNSTNRVTFPFLGGALSLPDGIRRIAARTGAKLVYAAIHSRAEIVEIRLHALSDNPHAALLQSVKLFEQDIIQNPSHWWLWNCAQTIWLSEMQQDKKGSICT